MHWVYTKMSMKCTFLSKLHLVVFENLQRGRGLIFFEAQKVLSFNIVRLALIEGKVSYFGPIIMNSKEKNILK